MATIKSFTSLEQSRKLAEFLPLESADMWWAWYSSPVSNGHYDDYPMFCKPICNPDESVPCWSLSALLSLIPYYSLHKTFSGLRCDSYNKEGTSCILGETSDNPIDACYEMILKFNELKML